MKKPLALLGVIVTIAIVVDVLWTRSRPASSPPPPAPATTNAAARGGGAANAPKNSARDAGAKANVVVSAPWGSGPGQLGRRQDPESVVEGPMSFLVDARDVLVLDNVNRRLVRFRDGRPLAPITLDNEAAQDVARAGRDRVAVLDRLRDKRVTIYDADGRVAARAAIAGEAPAVTGLFGDRDGELWLEREHKQWSTLDGARTAPGRPTRDGRFVAGAIVDRAAGRARVQVFAGDGTPAWDAVVDFGAPLMFLALLDGDAGGSIYVGAHTGRESATPPYRIDDESLTLVALGPDGRERARLTLPAPPPREEAFRELWLGDDGTLYWMRRSDGGVTVEAYRL